MQYNIKCFLWAIVLLTLISGCKKDNITTTTSPIIEDKENVDLLIHISNEANEPVEAAILTDNMTGLTYTADENGLILIKGQTIPGRGLPITITKTGYLKEIALLQGITNSKNTAAFTLKTAVATVMVQGTTGSIDGNGSLTLPTEIVYENGDPYPGVLLVQSRYFSPDEVDFLRNAPGNMLAEDEDGNLQTLLSYGMYTIELSDGAGNELELADGATAMIEFPLATNQAGNAPTEIPLWHLNETTAMWEQEGGATLDGNSYKAEVTHFSSWNCDIPFDPIHVCLTVLGENGTPLPYTDLLASQANLFWGYDYGTTNEAGEICLFVPENEDFVLSVVFDDNIVSAPLNIPGLSENTNLGNQVFQVDSYEITGNALDCDNTTLNEVYIRYEQNGEVNYTYSSGNFEFITLSNSLMSLRCYDLENNQISEEQQVPLTASNIDLGDIEVCDENTVGTTIVVPAGLINSDVTWTNNNIYILEGLTIVSGAILTIEPGTIIKAQQGTLLSPTILLIATDGQIQANGTVNEPIIFTSALDNIEPGELTGSSVGDNETGLWGGVVILGNAPISDFDGGGSANLESIENVPESAYGGNQFNHNSGSFTYVSIRYGGREYEESMYVDGLTLGGVGAGTTVENVEITSCFYNGLRLLGGTVNPKNMAVFNYGKIGFFVDKGYGGTLENIVSNSLPTNNPLQAMMVEGPENSTINSQVACSIRQGSMAGPATIYAFIGNNALGSIEDLYFFDFQDNPMFTFYTSAAIDNFINGLLRVENCAFNDTNSLEDISDTLFAGQDAIVDGIFADPANGNVVTSTPTVGADISEFEGWTWGDANGILNMF